MAEVSFEEDRSSTHSYAVPSRSKGIPQWLVANGFARTEAGANILLLSLSVVSIIIAIALYILMPTEKTAVTTPQERAQLEATTPKPPSVPH